MKQVQRRDPLPRPHHIVYHRCNLAHHSLKQNRFLSKTSDLKQDLDKKKSQKWQVTIKPGPSWDVPVLTCCTILGSQCSPRSPGIWWNSFLIWSMHFHLDNLSSAPIAAFCQLYSRAVSTAQCPLACLWPCHLEVPQEEEGWARWGLPLHKAGQWTPTS